VLGHAADIKPWHGLPQGFLHPTAWWEKEGIQWHHDGSFSAKAPAPPMLVAMYCEEAPTEGGSKMRWASAVEREMATTMHGMELCYAPGATLFYSTRRSLEVTDKAIVARARRMQCCYKEGFATVVEGKYPLMSPTGLSTVSPPPDVSLEPPAKRHRSITEFEPFEHMAFGTEKQGAVDGEAGSDEYYRHSLVQKDGMTGNEFVAVHSVCLHHLECTEDTAEGANDITNIGSTNDSTNNGSTKDNLSAKNTDDTSPSTKVLSWAESQAFVESLLAPACCPPHVLALHWRVGDVGIWDNLQLQHSVTPSIRNGCDDGYAAMPEQRRLMTRTAFQPAGESLR
jgi:hypothetical protein